MQILQFYSISLSLLIFYIYLVHAKKSNSEICNDSSDCNQNAGLYCITNAEGNRTCGCPTNETVFDVGQGRCVGKAGFNCVLHENKTFCPEKSYCSHQDPIHVGLYYYEPKCFCEAKYFAKRNGTCSPSAPFSEKCDNENKKCDELSRMKCHERKCLCEFPEDQYYDPKIQKCISYFNGSCSDYYSCVENARCEGIQAARARTFMTAKGKSDQIVTVTNVGKCICEYGYTPTKDRKCMGGYRQTCSSSQPCNAEDDLECQDGSCNCKNPLHMYYEYNMKRCMKLVGAKCDSDKQCVDHAECNNGLCACQDNYSKTPYRRCMLGYNKTCENEKCNLHSGLACKNSRCSCVDETLTYNDVLQACVSRINSPCGKIGQAGDYGKDPFYVSCQPGAICKQEPNGDANTLFCRAV